MAAAGRCGTAISAPLLQDSDASVCSPVERKDNTLYWSVDGEDAASAVSTLPGNPENLQ